MLSLHRYPVKSLAGEPVDALRVDRRGAGGDRTHALIWAGTNRRLTARQAPRMLAWHARYDVPGAELDPADPPLPLLTAPDGTEHAWDDPALPAALEADLGWPVVLRRDVSGQQDLDDTLLVTVRLLARRARRRARHPAPTCAASARTSTSSSTPSRSPRRAGRAGGCAWATRS